MTPAIHDVTSIPGLPITGSEASEAYDAPIPKLRFSFSTGT